MDQLCAKTVEQWIYPAKSPGDNVLKLEATTTGVLTNKFNSLARAENDTF